MLSKIQESDKFQGIHSARDGLILVVGVSIASRYVHGLISNPTLNKAFSEILIVVLLGLYIRNKIGLEPKVKAGIEFAIHYILRLGIILLGLRFCLQDVVATGKTALILVGICITTALTLSYLTGRLFNVPTRLAMLIGIGTAICGNSAIIATAPVIEAEEEEVSFAVATITLFGLLAVLLYPIIGHLFGLSDTAFGLWAGSAVNDTSQVVAVGAAFSDTTLDVATVVKLTRNTIMAPLILIVGLFYSRGMNQKEGEVRANSSRPPLTRLVPGFILGFFALSLFRTAGVAAGFLPQDLSDPGQLITAASILTWLNGVAKFSILMALAGVGLNTDLTRLKQIGPKPLIIGTSVAIVLSILSISLILCTPLGY